MRRRHLPKWLRGLSAVLCGACLTPGDARADIPSRTVIDTQTAPTFIVGDDGAVYETDFGATTLDIPSKRKRFSDRLWTALGER